MMKEREILAVDQADLDEDMLDSFIGGAVNTIERLRADRRSAQRLDNDIQARITALRQKLNELRQERRRR